MLSSSMLIEEYFDVLYCREQKIQAYVDSLWAISQNLHIFFQYAYLVIIN